VDGGPDLAASSTTRRPSADDRRPEDNLNAPAGRDGLANNGTADAEAAENGYIQRFSGCGPR